MRPPPMVFKGWMCRLLVAAEVAHPDKPDRSLRDLIGCIHPSTFKWYCGPAHNRSGSNNPGARANLCAANDVLRHLRLVFPVTTKPQPGSSGSGGMQRPQGGRTSSLPVVRPQATGGGNPRLMERYRSSPADGPTQEVTGVGWYHLAPVSACSTRRSYGAKWAKAATTSS